MTTPTEELAKNCGMVLKWNSTDIPDCDRIYPYTSRVVILNIESVSGSLEQLQAFREAVEAESDAERMKQAAVGWRVKYEYTGKEPIHMFTNGAPSSETVRYWEEQGEEIEYCYAQPLPSTEQLQQRVKELAGLLQEAPNYFSHHEFDGDKLAWIERTDKALANTQ